jgi:membrane AbrB-like protein
LTCERPPVIDKDQAAIPASLSLSLPVSVPSRFKPYLDQMVTLAAALAGGVFLAFTPVPAPWLTGAMLGAAGAGIWRPLKDVGPTFRDLAFLLGGLSLGCAVRPETLRAFAHYPLSLAILAIGVVLTIVLSTYALTRVFRWRRVEAVLASTPGALSTVVAIASSENCDLRRVVVVQMVRLFVIIACLPSVMIGSGMLMADVPLVVASPMTALETAEIFAIGLIAAFVAMRLRFPSPWFLGPMVAAGSLTGSGLITDVFPPALAIAGFVMIGAYMGVRFHGLKARDIFNIFPAALVSLAITLVTAFSLAFIAHWVARIPTAEALIAFAPGGLEAMAILAFALHLDPVFIGAHHLARFLGIGLGLPLVIRFWPRLFGIQRDVDDAQMR